MSFSTGCDSSSVAAEYLGAILHPLLNSLAITHTFLTLLIPLTICMFYFSTPQIRRRPLFILNLGAIFLAFVSGVLIDAFVVHSILQPLKPWPLLINILIGLLGIGQSILVDLTLLVRLISVYPSRQIGPIRFSFLITIPVLLKICRVINAVVFTKVMVSVIHLPDAAEKVQMDFVSKPYLKIEWAAQMIDNTYASIAFLWKIRAEGNRLTIANPSGVTLVQRLRTLSRIALTNFIVPTVFSIAQFVCLYRDIRTIVLNQLMLVNLMLSTFGIAFATVWAGRQILESKRNTVTSLRLTPGSGSALVEDKLSPIPLIDPNDSPDEKPSDRV